MKRVDRVGMYLAGIERRVRELLALGDGFDGAGRLRSLYDESLPLLATWQSNGTDAVRLEEIEREVQAVGVAMRVRGKSWDRKTVKGVIDGIASDGVSKWLESEVLSGEITGGDR